MGPGTGGELPPAEDAPATQSDPERHVPLRMSLKVTLGEESKWLAVRADQCCEGQCYNVFPCHRGKDPGMGWEQDSHMGLQIHPPVIS